MLDAWCDPELERLEARLAERTGAPASAIDAAYGRSLDLARERGAAAFALRTARSQADWLIRQGRSDAARNVLVETLRTEPLVSCTVPWGQLDDARRVLRSLTADNPS